MITVFTTVAATPSVRSAAYISMEVRVGSLKHSSWVVVFIPAVLAVGGCGSSTDNKGGASGAQSGTASGSGSSGLGLSGSLYVNTGDAAFLGSGSSGDAAAADGAVGQSSALMMTIRDFKMYDPNDPQTNPDFENLVSDDRGIVERTLGADDKPVYASTMNADGGGNAQVTATTHGKAWFDQWYNDVPGMNINVPYPIALTQNGSNYGFDSLVSGVPTSTNDPSNGFFPIDDGTQYATMFGNQGKAHNYSFTTELHTVFTYRGGEMFSFSGDDDVFVFINKALVIDLGGVHVREQASVMLDSLGLIVGQEYPLELFGAERHTDQSNVSFQTTLALRPAPPIPR